MLLKIWLSIVVAFILIGVFSALEPRDPRQTALMAASVAAAMELRHPGDVSYPHMALAQIVEAGPSRYDVQSSVAVPNGFGGMVESGFLARVYVPPGRWTDARQCTVESLQWTGN